MRLARVMAIVLCSSAAGLQARDLYVDAINGSDTNAAGTAPYKTIAKAVQQAQPGDCIHLTPSALPYRETVTFLGKRGEPGRPIVLDGHGATLYGAEPIKTNEWPMVAPGLYRFKPLNKPASSTLQRWYFIFDGQMNLMGRSSKMQSRPLKAADALQPVEWTYAESEGAFYIRIDPAKTLSDCRIEAPVRQNGVEFFDHCEHVVIRNLNVTRVLNDGFNIHGSSRQIRFENIQARECGDDGLSAHKDCEVAVKGFVSFRNATGICHVNCRSTAEEVRIEECRGYDYYMVGAGAHTLSNSVIMASASNCVVVGGGGATDETCTVQMDQVKVANRRKAAATITIEPRGVFDGRRLTLDGVGVVAAGDWVTLRDSVIGGDPRPEIVLGTNTQWRAERNIYHVQRIRIGDRRYDANEFESYRMATGQDRGSQWRTGDAHE